MSTLQFDEKHNNPTIEDVKLIDGKDFAMLNEREKVVCDYFSQNGRKFGVAINVINSAPKEELELANSKSQYNQIVSRYPSKILITLTKE